jgi:hypothetical protein
MLVSLASLVVKLRFRERAPSFASVGKVSAHALTSTSLGFSSAMSSTRDR